MLTKPKKVLSIPKLLKKAQIIFNTWIRNRDKDKGCISCGSEVSEAGHYFSQGHHSNLRFNEINCNGQCTKCNCFLHGNLINYRHGLIKRYGEEKLNLLESAARQHKKWTRLELEIICQLYKKCE